MSRWTLADIERLKNNGLTVEEKPAPKGQKRTVKPSKEKTWLKLHLTAWCGKNGLKLIEEHRFHSERRFRADWAIIELNLLIEYEGLFSKKSRHTTASGFTTDTEKYNLCQIEGWRVLRYTALNYRNILNDLNKLFKPKEET